MITSVHDLDVALYSIVSCLKCLLLSVITGSEVHNQVVSPSSKKLSKADDDQKDRLGELLTAARERMVCLRAAKKKHKNVPCWDQCQTLIDDLKAPGVLYRNFFS